MNNRDANISVLITVRRASARIGFVFATLYAKIVRTASVVAYLYTVKPFYVIENVLLTLEIHLPHSLFVRNMGIKYSKFFFFPYIILNFDIFFNDFAAYFFKFFSTL